jgi:hypothetical protein
MKQSNELLQRMLRAAREPRVETQEEAPFGFASRVAARWAAPPCSVGTLPLWERLCGRVAVGMAVAAVAVGLSVWQSWVPVERNEEAALMSQLNELLFVP